MEATAEQQGQEIKRIELQPEDAVRTPLFCTPTDLLCYGSTCKAGVTAGPQSAMTSVGYELSSVSQNSPAGQTVPGREQAQPGAGGCGHCRSSGRGEGAEHRETAAST